MQRVAWLRNVQAAHLVTLRQQGFTDIRSDEAGTASDEHSHCPLQNDGKQGSN